MPRFTVRVELYGSPTRQDYDSLHFVMQRAKYFRVIYLDKKWWHLPTAEYTANFENKDTPDVRDQVQSIAESVWNDVATLVTKADGSRYTSGLREATASEVKALTS
jgi:hypothetical protein